MNEPAYTSTLKYVVENREPERAELSELTEAFLKQGGAIKKVSSIFVTEPEPLSKQISAYNAKKARISKKARDRHVDSIKKLLMEGKNLNEICVAIGVSHATLSKTINENDLYLVVQEELVDA